MNQITSGYRWSAPVPATAEHLDRGDALQLSERRKCGQEYDPKEHEFFITRMMRVCTPAFFERVRGFGLESDLPVFVVGLPRSGTTLIEQILASHSQVFGAGEIKLASDTMAALGGQGADSTEGLRQLDCQTAHRLASQHWRKVLPVPLLEVDYEETVADLEGVARKLVAWCGLEWEPTCLESQRANRPVRTASAVQVRQPIFRTSVGRSKHYEPALASLFARLEGADARNDAGR